MERNSLEMMRRRGTGNLTFQEIEQSVKELRDNQIVQGQILNRVELNLERVTERLEGLETMVERNTQAIERNSEAIGRLADGIALVQSAMKGLVQTVEGLSATVDRFIRGMEGDGHRG
jgi:methyl-accepting chemotaxis protein